MQMNSNTPAQKNQAENSPISENIVTRKIGEIILDPKINTREVDSGIVVEYKEAIEGYGAKWQDHWNELPHITESNHLWSGFHTISAARLVFGDTWVTRCIVEGETHRDAYFLATRTNAQHGRRRTNLEKQTSVDRWLEDEDMCQWSDGYIAKHCHVTDPFVGKRRLQTVRSQPTKRKFINVQGDVEWMHTTRIGKTQAPPPKADQFPPPLTAKLKYEKFDAMILHRDAAYDCWKAYCDQWKIDFNWDDFCLYAEKHLDGRGCVSAINPEEATLDQIRAKSLTWQKMKDAIGGNANWVVSHRLGLEHQEYRRKQSEPTAEEPEEAEVSKGKRQIMDEYDDLTSEAYSEWDKHLKKFMEWPYFYDAAKDTYFGLRSVSNVSPADEPFDKLHSQVTIWRKIRSDMDFAILQLDDLDNIESTENWLLKKLIADQKEAADSKPDLEGLRNNLKRFQGSDTEPNPSILSKAYHVPEDVVRSEIKNAEPANPLPVSPKNPPKQFESTNVGIVFAAHNEAKSAYIKMMGGEQAEKANEKTVSEKYWDAFCHTAKKNAPRGKGLPKGKHDGTTVDSYPLDKAERIVECWEWIRDQCQPGLNNQAEQDLCNLNLLKCDPPALWIQNWIYETCCKMSDFTIVVHGLNYEGEIGRLEFKAPVPLSPDNLERIVSATQEAIDFEIQEILAEHETDKEVS